MKNRKKSKKIKEGRGRKERGRRAENEKKGKSGKGKDEKHIRQEGVRDQASANGRKQREISNQDQVGGKTNSKTKQLFHQLIRHHITDMMSRQEELPPY